MPAWRFSQIMQSGLNFSNNYPFRPFKSVKSSVSQSMRCINKFLKVKCLSEPQISKLEGNSGKDHKPNQVTEMEKNTRISRLQWCGSAMISTRSSSDSAIWVLTMRCCPQPSYESTLEVPLKSLKRRLQSRSTWIRAIQTPAPDPYLIFCQTGNGLVWLFAF